MTRHSNRNSRNSRQTGSRLNKATRSRRRRTLSAEQLESRQMLTRLLPGNEFQNGPLAAGEVVFVDFELEYLCKFLEY